MVISSRIRFGFFILSAFLLLQTSKVFASDAKFAKITNISLDKNQSGHVIDLQFDKPFSAKLLKPAYERNFIQLVLKGTKIDAARIIPSTVNGSQFSKVFAYAYTPDTSRIRLIFNSDKAPQGKITIFNANPKSVRVVIKDASVASSVTIPLAPKTVAAPAPLVEKPAVAIEKTAEEKKILKEVVENTKEVDIHNPETIKSALAPAPAAAEVSGIDKNPAVLAAGQMKPIPESIGRPSIESQNKQVGTNAEPSKHFGRMLIALFGVIGLFVGGVFGVKKYSDKLKKLPFGKKERIIQVVATHYLGQKKSISLVKVAGEYMVVGVGSEGLSLISKLGAEANVDKYLEDRFWGGTFEKHLDNYQSDKSILQEGMPAAQKDGGFAEALAKGFAGAGGLMSKLGKKPASTVAASTPIEKKYDGAINLGADIEEEDDSYAAAIAASVTGEKVELSGGSAKGSNLREKLTKLKPLS